MLGARGEQRVRRPDRPRTRSERGARSTTTKSKDRDPNSGHHVSMFAFAGTGQLPSQAEAGTRASQRGSRRHGRATHYSGFILTAFEDMQAGREGQSGVAGRRPVRASEWTFIYRGAGGVFGAEAGSTSWRALRGRERADDEGKMEVAGWRQASTSGKWRLVAREGSG